MSLGGFCTSGRAREPWWPEFPRYVQRDVPAALMINALYHELQMHWSAGRQTASPWFICSNYCSQHERRVPITISSKVFGLQATLKRYSRIAGIDKELCTWGLIKRKLSNRKPLRRNTSWSRWARQLRKLKLVSQWPLSKGSWSVER